MSRLAVVLVLAACGGGGDSGDGDPKDAAPTDDSQQTMQDGSMTTPDASFGPGAICGNTTCMTTEGCCTGAMISCKAENDCPTQFFACDGPEDCGGGTCCFGNGGQMGSECRAAGQNCGEVACHADADCGGATPKCCPKSFTPSYNVCLAACP